MLFEVIKNVAAVEKISAAGGWLGTPRRGRQRPNIRGASSETEVAARKVVGAWPHWIEGTFRLRI